MVDIRPDDQTQSSMWRLVEELFPRYRALCGPDFGASLDHIRNWLDLEILSIPSGQKVGDWTIPNEFVVNEAWVEDKFGKRHLDFKDHPYHLWIYSRPFQGVVDKAELLKKVDTMPYLPTAIPLRQTYYRDDWGFCGSQEEVARMPDGPYKVHVDTTLKAGVLRIGEFYLPGAITDEILINTYLCHPRGANDNLSGVAVSVELFRLLSRLPRRRLSYRLAIWPETIGAITWINTQPQKLKNVVGGFEVSICGDSSPLSYNESFFGNALVDRAIRHAQRHSGKPLRSHRYRHAKNGSDQGHFNAPGIRRPYGRLARSGAGSDAYQEYHSSADNLDVVRPEYLQDTLEFLWQVVGAMDRTRVWTPTYVGTPFLSARGVYPYQHAIGRGQSMDNQIAASYYDLMGSVDGELDLLEIADRCDLPIGVFDEAVEQFHRAGLIR